MTTLRLPTPPAPDEGVAAAVAWTLRHLGDLAAPPPADGPIASARFRGGQRAADAALAGLDLAGYAADRNEVLPVEARGATGLSPYVRHGLLDLPTLWRRAADAPPRDRDRFRDELLWQEYARHVYARLGRRTGAPLRNTLTPPNSSAGCAAPRSEHQSEPRSVGGRAHGRDGVHDARAGRARPGRLAREPDADVGRIPLERAGRRRLARR
jgi:hypothetical protein